jgi:K+-transporting ATPase ATPase C chain
MKSWIADLRISAILTFLLVVLCCGIYPALVWGIARSAGSLMYENGNIVGSRLIGQPFSGPGYFHPRPSAAGKGYDATASGGTNLGPLSKKLTEDVRRRVIAYRQENGMSKDALVPADAVTSSASGLDPDISVANARLQTQRVAEARHSSVEIVMYMVKRHTRGRTFGLLGEPRVNVLELNLNLDRRFGKGGTP